MMRVLGDAAIGSFFFKSIFFLIFGWRIVSEDYGEASLYKRDFQKLNIAEFVTLCICALY